MSSGHDAIMSVDYTSQIHGGDRQSIDAEPACSLSVSGLNSNLSASRFDLTLNHFPCGLRGRRTLARRDPYHQQMRALTASLLLLSASALQALSFSTSGPFGPALYPTVSKVAVTPGEPGLLYAVSGGALYRSRDYGDTWLPLPPPPIPLDFVAFDPTNADTIYTVGFFGNPWRSSDGGTTWTELTNGVPSPGFQTIALLVDPNTPSTLYIAGTCSSRLFLYGGVYSSTDRGETWSPIWPSTSACVRYLWLDPARPYGLYFGSWLSLSSSYYTENGGKTWAITPTGPPARLVATDPLHPSKSYELTTVANSLPVLRVSTDGEVTWQTVAAAGLPPRASDFIIDPARGRLLLAGSDGLYISDDSGVHWSALYATLGSSLAITGDFLYVYGDVCVRLPLATFADPVTMKIGTPHPRTEVSIMALDPRDAATLFVAGADGFGTLLLWRTHDSGRNWEQVTMVGGPAGSWPSIFVDAAGDLYATNKGVVWRFAKLTQTWESWTVADLDGYGIAAANPQRPGWLYAFARRLLSTDGGHTWQPMQNIEPGEAFFSFAPNGFDVSAHVGTRIWASHDGGVTWSRLADGIDWSSTKEAAFAASRPLTIYRTVDEPNFFIDEALFRSDDGGTTWVPLHRPGEQFGGGRLLVDPRDDRSVWIGLEHSADGGTTWTDESGNLPAEKGTRNFAIDASGAELYVLPSDESSIWRATLRGNHTRAIRHP